MILHEISNREIAIELVKQREKWEKEQLKKGKKEVRVPHPDIDRTFIIKFI